MGPVSLLALYCLLVWLLVAARSLTFHPEPTAYPLKAL
jgi:hypothetical protein